MAEITNEELIRMQNEAKMRVQEMQKRAKLTYDAAQGHSDEKPSVVSNRKNGTSIDGSIVETLLQLLQPAHDPILDAVLGLLRWPAGQNDPADRF